MESVETVTLYRPAGPAEMELVAAQDFRRWPPRLPEQPIFYPVTNEQYATEITTMWNVKEFGSGVVTRFEVERSFMDRYEVHCVGAPHATEWWIPAAELEDLNEHIVGQIEVIAEYDHAGRKA